MDPPEYLEMTGCLAQFRVLALFCLFETVPAQDNPVTVRDENSLEPSATTVKKLTQLNLEGLTSIQVDTVHSASKPEQKVTEAPASSVNSSAEEIKQQFDRILGDRLRSGPGTYVTYDRAEGAIGSLGVNRPFGVSGFWVPYAKLFSQEIITGSAVPGSVYNLFNQFYHQATGKDFTQDTIQQDGWQCRIKET